KPSETAQKDGFRGLAIFAWVDLPTAKRTVSETLDIAYRDREREVEKAGQRPPRRKSCCERIADERTKKQTPVSPFNLSTQIPAQDRAEMWKFRHHRPREPLRKRLGG
ncbi:MAG TPA: hypothetical protein VMJ32_11870, partial [Pirellulales bacterium]|nr:hypothetical protein [Pirellulales bacterium]